MSLFFPRIFLLGITSLFLLGGIVMNEGLPSKRRFSRHLERATRSTNSVNSRADTNTRTSVWRSLTTSLSHNYSMIPKDRTDRTGLPENIDVLFHIEDVNEIFFFLSEYAFRLLYCLNASILARLALINYFSLLKLFL